MFLYWIYTTNDIQNLSDQPMNSEEKVNPGPKIHIEYHLKDYFFKYLYMYIQFIIERSVVVIFWTTPSEDVRSTTY